MKYLYSELYDKKVRVDLDSDKAFILDESQEEYEAPTESKVVADATFGRKFITKEEYFSKTA
jgi:hypothetical protein